MRDFVILFEKWSLNSACRMISCFLNKGLSLHEEPFFAKYQAKEKSVFALQKGLTINFTNAKYMIAGNINRIIQRAKCKTLRVQLQSRLPEKKNSR